MKLECLFRLSFPSVKKSNAVGIKPFSLPIPRDAQRDANL